MNPVNSVFLSLALTFISLNSIRAEPVEKSELTPAPKPSVRSESATEVQPTQQQAGTSGATPESGEQQSQE